MQRTISDLFFNHKSLSLDTKYDGAIMNCKYGTRPSRSHDSETHHCPVY